MIINKEKFNEMSNEEILAVIKEFNETNELKRTILVDTKANELLIKGYLVSGKQYKKIISLSNRESIRTSLMSQKELAEELRSEGYKVKEENGYIIF